MTQIFVAIIAGVLTLITAIIMNWHKNRQEGISLKRAIIGEIESLLLLIKTRNYKQNLNIWIEDIKNGRELSRKSFMSNPNNNYFLIFESNASKIGKLPSKSTTYVVQFYTLLKSLLEDAVNEELYTRPNDKIIETLKENIDILEYTIQVGENAVKKLKGQD